MLVCHEKILYQKTLTLGYYQPTMKQETQQTPFKCAYTKSMQRRNLRNMDLRSESQQKGHGHEFLAKSWQRNHECEFMAKAHNGGYTQSNLQRNHDREFLENSTKELQPQSYVEENIWEASVFIVEQSQSMTRKQLFPKISSNKEFLQYGNLQIHGIQKCLLKNA